MAELLGDRCLFSLDTVKVAFEDTTKSRSKLRRLVCNWLVAELNCVGGVKHSDLDVFDGVPGFARAFSEALERWYLSGKNIFLISSSSGPAAVDGGLPW
ncbi:hypothetical protein LTR37_007467 [Vermiconidia calcicola]|uniref:Uncharacterized protein n=1 Tax=Vermiconidia calcicola TaxID=1690605 RepID=A0ACC3NDF5_9PEZI|nr:hypothetical protein LTR37_007467 [Vermiconidia calcicola]